MVLFANHVKRRHACECVGSDVNTDELCQRSWVERVASDEDGLVCVVFVSISESGH